jgi:IclR family transcriptional regulator, KDG regulon repressor
VIAPDSTTPARNTINAVTNALELLEVLAAHDGSRLSDLSQHSGFTLNQTFRLLETLETAGYVTRERDKRYRLGHKLHLLGVKAEWPHGLVSSAASSLDALAALSGESVLLAVRSGLQRMIVDSRPSTYSLRVDWGHGSKLPLHVGGLGVALLAFSPHDIQNTILEQADAGHLTGFTPDTLTTRAALQTELQRVRESGVRVSRDDWAVGEFSVAAPILAEDGTARGALNIAGFTARLTPDLELRYIEAVKAAARDASRL